MHYNFSGLKILSWNVGGAKFLSLPESSTETNDLPCDRRAFRSALNNHLGTLLAQHQPDFVFLQEIVQYERYPNPSDLIAREWENYYYLPSIAIDTLNQNHPLKWQRYREGGGWSDDAYLGQGYGLLWKKNIRHCPVFADISNEKQLRCDNDLSVEIVHIDTGLYSGDRDTEPRLAVVAHFVLRGPDGPVDIFVVNLHLSTLNGEREGVPSTNRDAKLIREKQLDLVLDGIVSRYNHWWNKQISEKNVKRHRPLWILGGDFNCLPDSCEITKIKEDGFITLVNDQQPTKASGLGGETTIILDYLFAGLDKYSLDASVRQAGFMDKIDQNSKTIVDGPMISDHCPILGYLPVNVSV